MGQILTGIFALLALTLVAVFYQAGDDIVRNISPQGCRMSWMSPSYILQSNFNSSWTRFSTRYSLWLYREVGWEPNQAQGLPVLFIPGNAGSSHQVRSIASSAARQYFSSPYVIATDFMGRSMKPLDFFAVEFNEDLSAFHGPTLDSQTAYTSDALMYILSLYPPNTRIILLGHSMGGIVAISLLPSNSISTVITMSTPHTLPPARFDSRIDEIYARNMHILRQEPTPILSICGGATDLMIPSEFCILPSASSDAAIYRRTVFTSALEGAWTGVGHREMVWCHQVRWRVARAALELGAATSTEDKAVVLDKWLRDGHILPPVASPRVEIGLDDPAFYEMLPEDTHLVLKSPRGTRMYLLPVISSTISSSKFILYVSQGSILPVSPQKALLLHASVYFCWSSSRLSETNASISCTTLHPTTLKLVPNPAPGMPFPTPDEGSDESDGVVVFQADIPPLPEGVDNAWVGVRVEGADGQGWVIGAFDSEQMFTNHASALDLMFGKVFVDLSSNNSAALRSLIYMPNLLSNSLLVYRLTTTQVEHSQSCAESLLPPLLMHTSNPAETHYHSLSNHTSRSALLHTHSSAPYIPSVRSTLPRGVNLTIYSSGRTGCRDITGFEITVDWWASIGRLATRYPTTLVCWAVGIASIVLFHAWGPAEKGHMPSVSQSLTNFVKRTLPSLLISSFVVSSVPLPSDYYLGTEGELVFSPIAPLLVLIATGLVCISWYILVILMWPLGRIKKLILGRRKEYAAVQNSTLISLLIILLLIFVFVPWQVAYLGCWIIHLHTCATYHSPFSFPGSAPTLLVDDIPLLNQGPDNEEEMQDGQSDEDSNETRSGMLESSQFPSPQLHITSTNVYNQNTHILLLLTWLLPLAAPVLAVWVRTLLTAGYTTPFNGDHNFLKVAPVLVLVEYTSRRSETLLFSEKRISVRWGFIVLASVAFLAGSRTVFRVYDFANLQIALIVIARIGWRYFVRDGSSDSRSS